ncbi:MAG: sulfite exporter TauE/SafE family protein [Comamonadaceae bacterium]|nr:sulfite exporter TauE/SafE family protein [Comamonadaceae bacterium]
MTLDAGTYGLAAILIFAVSFVFAMLGLGGGMLYVPILKWLGMPLKAVAIPMGLLLNGLNTLLAFLRYWREGLVDFRGGAPAAVAALLLAPVGAWMTGMLPHGVLLTLFAIAVAAAGWRSLATADRPPPAKPMAGRRRIAIGATVGGAAGFIGGLLGLGGGFIVAPMLMELGYPAKQAAATTAFIVTFSSFSGFLGHMAEGRIDLTLAAVSVASVVAGSQLGAWFMAKKAKPAWVKKAYGVVLLAVAAQLAYGLLRR